MLIVHRFQNLCQMYLVGRMQSEDLQQPGIRGVAVAIGVAGFRSSISADAYVHNPNELREGLGRGISPADSHLNSLLDWAAFKRTVAVARQSTHANGLTPPTLFLDVLSLYNLHLFVHERRTCENILRVLSSSIDRSIHFFYSFHRIRYVKVESVVQISFERCSVTRVRRRRRSLRMIFMLEVAVSSWKN